MSDGKAPCVLVNAAGPSQVVVVCEHASDRIPDVFGDLGLDPVARSSHIAWDPGALVVAMDLAAILDAKMVHSTVSRLVYDCNRPPEAPDSIPARSEHYDVPGNQNLDAASRRDRARLAYHPFREMLSKTLAGTQNPVIVTIHSFTPTYFGKARATEVGILHDEDSRLADEMLKHSADHLHGLVERNQPYGPTDGVTHTLKEHGLTNGHLNVMIEIRNDLISTAQQQAGMALALARTLAAALKSFGIDQTVVET